MSKCIYKEIADTLDKQELEYYYNTHTCNEVCEKFNIDNKYLYRILHYLNIQTGSSERHSFIMRNYTCTPLRNAKVSESNKGRVLSSDTIKKISESNKKSYKYHKPSNAWEKGHVPWNKGTKGLVTWSDGLRDKYYNSLSERGWFQNSRPEEDLYILLINVYGKDDVIRGYVDKQRYPFRCDFYIVSEDMFIELNRFWHHGTHPFDENDIDDIKLLELWKSKSADGNQYFEAINTWTVRDVIKIKTAKQNNLNYQLIY